MKHTATASTQAPTLADKNITARVLRHTAATGLLHAGIDTTDIASGSGHESTDTTQIYLHSDLAIKEQALARTVPAGSAARQSTAARRAERSEPRSGAF